MCVTFDQGFHKKQKKSLCCLNWRPILRLPLWEGNFLRIQIANKERRKTSSLTKNSSFPRRHFSPSAISPFSRKMMSDKHHSCHQSFLAKRNFHDITFSVKALDALAYKAQSLLSWSLDNGRTFPSCFDFMLQKSHIFQVLYGMLFNYRGAAKSQSQGLYYLVYPYYSISRISIFYLAICWHTYSKVRGSEVITKLPSCHLCP